MRELHTIPGTCSREELGLIIPHEQVFVDLGPHEEPNWADPDPPTS